MGTSNHFRGGFIMDRFVKGFIVMSIVYLGVSTILDRKSVV